MLKHDEVNPLNVFGLRRVEHCPPHFVCFTFDLRVTDKQITDWVYENLAGRFFFGDHYSLDSKDHIAMCKCLAFEEPSELTYFGLFVDQLNSTSNDLF
jgi:hypothetical protein